MCKKKKWSFKKTEMTSISTLHYPKLPLDLENKKDKGQKYTFFYILFYFYNNKQDSKTALDYYHSTSNHLKLKK